MSVVFYAAMPSSELEEGAVVSVSIAGHELALCRSGDAVHALDDRCSHAGAKLSGGRVRDGMIICPLHGARFDLASGNCLSRVVTFAPVPVHRVREANGMIEVALDGARPAPGSDHAGPA